MSGGVAIGLLVVIVGAVVWRVFGGERHDSLFVVEVKAAGIDGVVLRGNVPGRSGEELVAFVASLDLPPGARIWAIRDREQLQLRFANVDAGPQQRLRNFVLVR